jgi:predicted AAA+ superfamily ATPase
MENSISSFVTKLIPLIETDRDGLLFIDGAWGTGKTHFIKTRLKDLYDKNTYFYISLGDFFARRF